jgi:hypothetical protein
MRCINMPGGGAVAYGSQLSEPSESSCCSSPRGAVTAYCKQSHMHARLVTCVRSKCQLPAPQVNAQHASLLRRSRHGMPLQAIKCMRMQAQTCISSHWTLRRGLQYHAGPLACGG